MERPVSAFSLLPLSLLIPALSSSLSLSGIRFPPSPSSALSQIQLWLHAAFQLGLSLPCCSSCRRQERWVGRKPWQLSLCRAPSSPPPARPGMGAVRWQTHNVSVCSVVVCVHVSLAAAQSQSWLAGPTQRGTVPTQSLLTLVCGGRRSLHFPPLASLRFGVGSVSLPCAYSWWYVLMVCCVWIP